MSEPGEVVMVEFGGQVVVPCVVLRSFGPFRRVQMPFEDGTFMLRWVPRYRVLAHLGHAAPEQTP